jgi:multiple sugar transport system substrate-binding protein
MRRTILKGALLAALAAAVPPATTSAQDVLFLSTQLRPIEEATKMRQSILKGAGPVTFVAEEPPQFTVRMQAETEAGKRTVSLVGALHGEIGPLVPMGALQPIDDMAAKLSGRGIPASLMQLGKLGTPNQQYIPWIQATYVMAAHKSALAHLPAGADVNALTYDQLTVWAKAVTEKTGKRGLGFPAGPKGLMHRFFQGYFYPSFTGGVVSTFKSSDAEAGWAKLKELWQQVNPNSTSYDFMQEPLLAGEVLIAFDHIARLKDALAAKPNDFVTFPAPAGPKGRGYMPVVAGLAIPKGRPTGPARWPSSSI